MDTVLVTGGSGFFGEILIRRLLAEGFGVVNIDLKADQQRDPSLTSIQGDIRDEALLARVFRAHRFGAVFHLAAILAHGRPGRKMLWTSNVDGTANVSAAAARHGSPPLVFTSTNCLWGRPFGRPVVEGDEPDPVELYGRSKWEAERILLGSKARGRAVVIRCPTIVDEGRLGLLAILFEFLREGRRLWLVGPGTNRYQFIYAQDLAEACIRAAFGDVDGVFNVGSENVPTLKDMFQHLVDVAGRGSVSHLPAVAAIPAMRLAYACGVSPLGPYQYRMITQSFEFDISKIKRALAWQPTLGNAEMLARAYDYYVRNEAEIKQRTDAVSDHKQPAKMGVIKLLKWVS